MNFNKLDAYWLVERLACFWVTKPWEMTLSCHSKNVVDLSLGICNVRYQEFIYWISFKFAVLATDAYRCLHMSLQSTSVSFMNFKNFIRVIDGMVVFYEVIETQCPWNFDRFSEFWMGNE